MTSEIPPFIVTFNEKMKEIQPLLFITRDMEIQQTAIESLAKFSSEIEGQKLAAIELSDEDYANALLGCECIVASLQAELDMWILLKQQKPDKAWDQLITAQRACIAAARAHEGLGRTSEQLWRRLNGIETLVFPPQAFMSSGFVIEKMHCSICEENYEDCSHIRGLPYMGQFCHTVITKLNIDHVALVDSPKDKSCRVLQIGVEGGMRNQMTWLIEQSDSD